MENEKPLDGTPLDQPEELGEKETPTPENVGAEQVGETEEVNKIPKEGGENIKPEDIVSPEDEKVVTKKLDNAKQKAKELLYEMRGLAEKFEGQEKAIKQARLQGEGGGLNLPNPFSPIDHAGHSLYEEIYQGAQESDFGGENNLKGFLLDTITLGIRNLVRKQEFKSKYYARLGDIQRNKIKYQELEKEAKQRWKDLAGIE